MPYPQKRSGGFRDKKRGGFGGNGGRPSFGGGRPNFGRDRSDGMKFRATCAKCGASCEVPFRPTGEKPVYCSDCFGAQRENSYDRGGQREDRREDRGGRDCFPKRDFSPSFAPKPVAEDKRIDTMKRQLDVLSAKVDQILAIVSNRPKVSVAIEKKPKKEIDEGAVKASLETILADVQKEKKKSIKSAKKKVPAKKEKKLARKKEKK